MTNARFSKFNEKHVTLNSLITMKKIDMNIQN